MMDCPTRPTRFAMTIRVALRRTAFTGANAVLSETGETFADLKAKRLSA